MITRIQPGARMSEAVVHGDTIYLSGQVGEPGDDVATQTRTALAEIEALLAEAGSDKSKILMAQIWLADIAAYFSGKAFGRHKLAPTGKCCWMCCSRRAATPCRR